MNFTPEFETVVGASTRAVPKPFVLLHIRDRNLETTVHQPGKYPQSEAADFRRRVDRFIDAVVSPRVPPGCAVVCISNNVPLRDRLCELHGYRNIAAAVKNTGNRGVLSEAELLDAALIKSAASIFSLSYYPWDSGFTLWLSRLFGVPAEFCNAESAIN
jgi:hypothetical protein